MINLVLFYSKKTIALKIKQNDFSPSRLFPFSTIFHIVEKSTVTTKNTVTKFLFTEIIVRLRNNDEDDRHPFFSRIDYIENQKNDISHFNEISVLREKLSEQMKKDDKYDRPGLFHNERS